MQNQEKTLKSHLVRYIRIWLVYLGVIIMYITSDIENTLLEILAFPLNIAVGYLIVQALEFKRAAKYIKDYYPNKWNKIKAHAIGNTIKSSWYNSSRKDFDDENISVIKKNLRGLGVLKVIMIILIIFVSLFGYYFG